LLETIQSPVKTSEVVWCQLSQTATYAFRRPSKGTGELVTYNLSSLPLNPLICAVVLRACKTNHTLDPTDLSEDS
jgi:hypothetical protein